MTNDPYILPWGDEDREWLNSVAPWVRETALRYPPGVYKDRTTGRPVMIASYTESYADGSCECVTVYSPHVDVVANVFGFEVENLLPWDGGELEPWEAAFFAETVFAEALGLQPDSAVE
jgi:hypothetical protein